MLGANGAGIYHGPSEVITEILSMPGADGHGIDPNEVGGSGTESPIVGHYDPNNCPKGMMC